MNKLIGTAYIEHWNKRISKGPIEAGTIENGNDTWEFIRPHVCELTPASILEYGCAYGRMLRHVQDQWPQARLYGVDLCKAALDHLAANWEGKPPVLFHRATPPPRLKVDLIYTNTVLQHVTDPDILQKIVDGFRAMLNPDGHLVLFENVTYANGGGGAHMVHLGPDGYTGLWPEFDWKDCGRFMHGAEVHELMIGSGRE